MSNRSFAVQGLIWALLAPPGCQPAPAARVRANAPIEPRSSPSADVRVAAITGVSTAANERAVTALGVTIRVPEGWTAEDNEVIYRWRGGEADSITITRIPAPNRGAFDALVDNARTIAIEEGWEVEALPPSASGALVRQLTRPARSPRDELGAAQGGAGLAIRARYEFDRSEYVLIQCVASIGDQAARARCVDRITGATLAPQSP